MHLYRYVSTALSYCCCLLHQLLTLSSLTTNEEQVQGGNKTLIAHLSARSDSHCTRRLT
jgi:hypothetical protein